MHRKLAVLEVEAEFSVYLQRYPTYKEQKDWWADDRNREGNDDGDDDDAKPGTGKMSLLPVYERFDVSTIRIPITIEAAKQLGQALQIEVNAGFVQAQHHPQRSGAKPVVRKATCHERVVVRPDRTVVIAHGIVARLAARERADAPAREALRLHELLRKARGPLRPHDA